MDRLGGIFGSRDRAYDPESHDDDDDEFGDYADDIADDHGENDIDSAPPSPVGQDERRMQVRAYNHWAGQLGDRHFPSITELDPEAISDFGPYSVLLDFSAGKDDPALRFLGDKLAAECSVEADLDHLSDVPSRSLLSRITDHYMQILANQAPIGFEAEFINQRGNNALYRGILLPYSSDDVTIDFIYGVINWKEIADQATADELLLEIGQALDRDAAAAGRKPVPIDGLNALIELDAEMAREDADELPRPAFGGAAPGKAANEGPAAPRVKRQALPTPDYAAEESADDLAEAGIEAGAGREDADIAAEDDWSIGETASDYGLPDDWDEPACDDVDDVVDPLADQSVGPGLSALVSRGVRVPNEAIMPSGPLGVHPFDEDADDGASEPFDGPRIPSAYEPEPEHAPEPVFAPASLTLQAFEQASEPSAELDPESVSESVDGGLYDCLAEARELAHVASSTEDRSRTALYRAVGRAYDVSIEAEADPEGFAELVADSGLTVQDRAPMTPVVKLVFGAGYDKTRLTEYAAVLAHARRMEVARGALADYLKRAPGGVKGVVREERRLRREEEGKPAAAAAPLRTALARKLRAIAPIALADLPGDGPEFALIMVRRTPEGAVEILGQVPDDVPLVERAARRLLA